ncbi:hypothetical protein D9M71_394230 [compost metagenome]
MQLLQQRQAADVLHQAGQQGVFFLQVRQMLGQAGAESRASQAEAPALVEDLLQARFLPVEQLAQLEGQHQAGQALAVELLHHVRQLCARPDMAEQGQGGELHQAFDQDGRSFQQGADLFGRRLFGGQQPAQPQRVVRHRRQRAGVSEETLVEREFHGVVTIVHAGLLLAFLD